jgi:deoxyribodipyrimidine photo-lyase
MVVDSKRMVPLHSGSIRGGRDFVLYWMQIQRRAESNDALNFAVEQADERGLPVLVYEGLRYDYPHASDRIHTFVLENARELRKRLHQRGIGHAFYLERNRRDRRKIVKGLLKRAALVVTDHYPAFIVPGQNRSLARLAEAEGVTAVAVDSCGVIPLAEFPKREYAARTIRPKIHRLLPYYLAPVRDPEPRRSGVRIDAGFREEDWRESVAGKVASCAIDHRVPPVSEHLPGGRTAALTRLRRFIRGGLDRYAGESNDPSRGATSGLSPYLHLGMISAREVALAVRGARPRADRNVAAFLEQLIVRRELAFNFCATEPRHDSLESLPDWARRTLAEHDGDEREHRYRREEFEAAKIHDELWNACQDEIRLTGTMHNYVRMLWGKKILEWSPSHAEALRTMIELNDRYGLDGRDPNSYTGFLWCFGLHDRAWGERPVYGKIRSMSSAATRRKVDAAAYIARIRSLKAKATLVEPSRTGG